MEEEDTQTYPAKNSSHPDLEHPTNVADLSKKRKLLEYESSNSGLPWPKNKIRDRCSGSIKGNSPKEPIDSRITDGLEQEESDNDSNSFIGPYDIATEFDAKGKAVDLPTQPLHLDQPSTSYSDSSYSLESKNISDTNDQTREGMEDNLQVEQGSISEYGKNDMEVEDNEADDDLMMLYSNDVATDAFVSSGQDARLGARKPTIDQEFEQYFSMLML